MAAGLVLCPFWHPPLAVLATLLVPMAVDGGVQMFTAYESGNFRRLITGTLFGFGLAELFLLSTAAVFRYGAEVGGRLFG